MAYFGSDFDFSDAYDADDPKHPGYLDRADAAHDAAKYAPLPAEVIAEPDPADGNPFIEGPTTALGKALFAQLMDEAEAESLLAQERRNKPNL